ncbi:MAG: ATP-binding protein [Candidatus Kapabacteria bacterium]|nr:ATP-binding protein [Candidatus Kapabacteria bacterium]
MSCQWLAIRALSIISLMMLGFGVGNAVFAQMPQNIASINLAGNEGRINIGRESLHYIEDASGKRSIQEVINADTFLWKNVPTDKPSFGFTRSAYWFRFCVQQSNSPLRSANIGVNTVVGFGNDWLLEIDYPPLDYITIFHTTLSKRGLGSASQADSLVVRKIIETGDRVPFQTRLVPHRNYVIPLVISDTATHVYYVRIVTESSLQVPMTLYRRDAFERHNTRFDMFYGALFGTMLTMVAYNLVLFFAMGVPSYLLFVLYMSASAWYYAAISGYGLYVVGEMPYWANTLTLVALFAAYTSLAFFARYFLQTFRHSPTLDKAHFTIGILGCIGLVGVFVLPYSIMVFFGSALVLIVSILCFTSSIVMIRRGNKSAQYFLIALAAFLVGGLTTLLRNVGLVPNNIFSVHSVEIGSALEGILFSFGLAGQYRMLKKQKEQAQEKALQLQKEANERLEEKVRERTLELEESNDEIQRQLKILDEQSREIEIANTTLQEKNLQLEDLNREKNEFLGIAAHDLKNPLSSITMSASIVLSYRDKLTQEMLEDRLQTILNTSGRMMEIIKNLLDVNAIESGQFAFTVEHVEMNEIASGLVNEYQDRAAAKSLELVYEPQAALTTVMGDKTALTEVLENLISNAIKYSPPHKRIFVTLTNRQNIDSMGLSEQPRTQSLSPITSILIAVRDEGPGLSDDDKTKLFGKFARLSARPTGGEHSTGLGLSIVKKMVEAMHGRVWCESELGKGAMFLVELPVSNTSSN